MSQIDVKSLDDIHIRNRIRLEQFRIRLAHQNLILSNRNQSGIIIASRESLGKGRACENYYEFIIEYNRILF